MSPSLLNLGGLTARVASGEPGRHDPLFGSVGSDYVLFAPFPRAGVLSRAGARECLSSWLLFMRSAGDFVMCLPSTGCYVRC